MIPPTLKQQIEQLGAGVFIRRRAHEFRLEEEDFHRAFNEAVFIWISPGEFRVENMDAIIDFAKKMPEIQCFRFPNVVVPEFLLTRIRHDFPKIRIEGFRREGSAVGQRPISE